MWLVAAAMAVVAVAVGGQENESDPLNSAAFERFAFRGLGPSLTTGRISDIDVDPKNPNVWYVAASSGNLWKTENRGTTWIPIFERHGSYSLGVVVVDPRDSNVVWLGTGENNNQRSVAFGDGVYKSTDAGKTWAYAGLAGSEHIGRITVDPRNSNVVYVAAIGPLWSSGGDRGLYKTVDGGKTWRPVLTISADTGVTDLAMDPKRPDVLYAAAYQRRRAVGQLIGGGPESGIYKSTDGGQKWTKLTKGLPSVDIGRIGLGVNWRNPNTVYALVTAQKRQGGFFRSDDGGASWKRIGKVVRTEGRGEGRGRGDVDEDDWYRGGDPGYYNEIIVDGHDPETIWSPQTTMFRSRDGGKTWAEFPMPRVHIDHHEIVFDPTDRNHMIVGNDGGVYETHDGGKVWRHFTNLPLSQFYRITTDYARPFYNVCGGAQDNGTICGPSRTVNRVGIRTSDWYSVAGGDGFQARVDSEDPNIIYAQSQNGSLQRLDLRTGRSVPIRPRPQNTSGLPPPARPEGAEAQAGVAGGQTRSTGSGQGRGGVAAQLGRWHWDSPLIISPHAARRLYYAGDKVYRSDDRGESWTVISPDLTRQLDATKIPIMGKVWPPDSVAFNQATTTLSTSTALDESPLLAGLLYVGTDDGLVQVTEDGGKSWRRVETFPGVAEYAYVTDVLASPIDVNTVFATFNNYQRGDFAPYVMKSVDRGRTWASIAGNLPARSGAWSIVQDHDNEKLLFVGLEFGVFFTVDGGTRWSQLAGGIPTIQARDLQIQKRESDLVVGTFGRGAFVLDDYSALRSITPEALAREATLLPLRDAYLYDELGQQVAAWGNEVTPNPPYGALFTYHLGAAADPGAKLVLTIADGSGKQVRRIELTKEQSAPGVHRVAWNLRGDPPPGAGEPAAGRGGGRFGQPPQGPEAAPGRYRATLGRMNGDNVTRLGEPVSFFVVALRR
jgi:photosystem II stability/assembly factor-like uncharacterized protein